VEFLRLRLIVRRPLLAQDGSIYVHLDERMAFQVKVLMDEVFGGEHYRNFITRQKCNPKNSTRKRFGNVCDFILFYTKSDEYAWNRPVQGWSHERIAKEYQYVEHETGRRYKKVPLHAPGVRHGETGKRWRGMSPPPGKHWQFRPETLEEMDRRGEIYWSPTGNPRRKIYLEDSDGVALQDLWLDCLDAHNQNHKITGYPTEKNFEMVARIVQASSKPDDIVLDCFSGSGTVLAAASACGRRWIGIDNSAEAIATTLRRFAVGPQRMGDYVASRPRAHKGTTAGFLPLEFERPRDKAEIRAGVLPLDVGLQNDKTDVPGALLIRDFRLYSSQPSADEIAPALSEWTKAVESIDRVAEAQARYVKGRGGRSKGHGARKAPRS
jgi:adenine-specific DNA-methyltransferase